MAKKISCVWNDMRDSVPEDMEQVLVASVDGDVTQCQYWEEDEMFMNDFDDTWTLEEVDFWMSLPIHPNQE